MALRYCQPTRNLVLSYYLLSTHDVIHITFWARLSPPFFFQVGQRSYVELIARGSERLGTRLVVFMIGCKGHYVYTRESLGRSLVSRPHLKRERIW